MPDSLGEVGVSGCCCTGNLCNYVPAVVETPYPGECVFCECVCVGACVCVSACVGVCV